MLIFLLFVLGFIFVASLIVGVLYLIPKLLVLAIAALGMFYIIDSIRRGFFD